MNHDLSQREEKLVFATNAGMFNPDFSPKGLYIENAKILRPLDKHTKGYGNFYLQPNGVFSINEFKEPQILKTQDFDQYSRKYKVPFATQSGPMLLIEGNVHPAFNEGSQNKRIRSGVGIMENGKTIFAISNQAVNFYDFALLFRDFFGCKNALYLDGSISEMYLPSVGKFERDTKFGAMIGFIK